jgi:large subunit ribosomal protein L25|tara:strand:- start:6 stop:713 length:708 start_codon:yes stop_codon:yes gene_type:complete
MHPWRISKLINWRIIMADQIPDLNATARSGTGKGAARKARREGLVPGVVYGGGQDPQAINVKYNVLFKMVKAGRFLSTLFNLKIEGQEDVRVICRNVQRHIVKDLPTHLDLMRLRRSSRVNLFIPVEFINEEDSPGLKRGGVLTVVRTEVELKVTASDIPEKLVANLDGLDIGDGITISNIEMPAGSRPMITDRDFVIANISAPSALKSSDDDDEVVESVESTDEGEENSDNNSE